MINLPPYPQHPIIKAGPYTLRQILPKDISNILELSFWNGNPAETIEQAIEIQYKVDEDYLQGNSIHWGIANEDDIIIGVCGYYRGLADGKGEIGFVLKEAYRGIGIMQQALLPVIKFGISIGLNYIFSITTADNQGAIRLLEKLNAIKMKQNANELEYQLFKTDS